MAETQMSLFAEAVDSTGGMFMSVKAGDCGVLTAIGREIMQFPMPNQQGNLAYSVKYRSFGAIYDFIWLRSQPFHLLLQKDLPIYLQSSSKTLKTYPVRTHLDEIRSPLTACCTSTGFYTCLGKTLYHFDLETGAFMRLSLAPKGVKCSEKTIVAAIDVGNRLVAAGTYSKLTYVVSPQEESTVAILEGQYGGVIQCTFDDFRLFTGGRADDTVLMWDLRIVRSPVNEITYYRQHNTQQRVLFSLFQGELRVGNGDGSVYVYDTLTGTLKSGFNAHFDAINSTQSCTAFPLITSSGQRHLPLSDLPHPPSSIRWWTDSPARTL